MPGADAAVDGPAIDGQGIDADLLVRLEFEGDLTDGAIDSIATLQPGACVLEGCPRSVPGVIGDAAKLDGVDDFFQFETVAALEFGGTNQPFSVSMWFRAADLSGAAQQVLMAQAHAGGRVSYQLSFEQKAGGPPLDLVWKVCEDRCQSDQFAIAADIDGTGRWFFAVATWDGSETRLFVDGDLMAIAAKSTIAFDGSPFMIGADLEGGGAIADHFNGRIDDLRIYRRALSQSEQLALMNEAGQ